MKRERLNFLLATSVFIGTIIGAGIFALPYVFAQSGFGIGLFWLFLICFILILTTCAYAEVVLRTSKDMEMPGYVNHYLGRKGKVIISLSLILGIYAALIGYSIGIGNFLEDVIGPIDQNGLFWKLITLFGLGVILYLEIKAISRLELAMAGGILISIIIIFFDGFHFIKLSNLGYLNYSNFFAPFGAVLFAFGGATAVPTMKRILSKNVRNLKKSILTGNLIVALVYTIFTFTILGISGRNTPMQAIDNLGSLISDFSWKLGIILGICTMSTSFLSLGYILMQVYKKDYNMPKFPSWTLVILIPLLLIVLGLRNFITVISIGGGLLSGVQGVILLLTWQKARSQGDRIPEFKIKISQPLFYFIIFIFCLGIISQIFVL